MTPVERLDVSCHRPISWVVWFDVDASYRGFDALGSEIQRYPGFLKPFALQFAIIFRVMFFCGEIFMLRTLCALGFAVALMTFSGCGGSKEALGPVDASDVEEVDKAEVDKGMQESAKHLPPGVKMPAGTVPDGAK
jgi:hypothetical protein